MVCLTLAANNFYSRRTYVQKSVAMLGIISEKDFQGIIFCNIYSFFCNKSFHFSSILFNLIGFLILKGSLDS